MELGKRLKELRTLKNLNQSDLANMLGIERSTYGKYETGDSSPDYEKLLILADFFEVSVDQLLGRTTSPAPTHIQAEAACKSGDTPVTNETLSAELNKFKEEIKQLVLTISAQQAIPISADWTTDERAGYFEEIKALLSEKRRGKESDHLHNMLHLMVKQELPPDPGPKKTKKPQ